MFEVRLLAILGGVLAFHIDGTAGKPSNFTKFIEIRKFGKNVSHQTEKLVSVARCNSF